MITIPPHSTVFHAPTGVNLENKTDEPLQVNRITLNGEIVYDTPQPVAPPPEYKFLPKGRLSKTVKLVRDPSGKIVGAELFEIPKV